MRANISLRDYENISAYLDGQLSTREKARFETQLRERPDLKMALDDMSRTRALLRMAPHRRAPRNFTLTPAMVEQSKPRRVFNFNLFPALSFSSALAALVLIATILFELMPGVSMETNANAPEAARSSDTTLMQAVPEATAAAGAMEAAPGIAAAPSADQAAPPVITWGIPPVSDMYGTFFGKGGGPGLDAWGRGGGGGGGGMDVPGMGGGAPDGNLVLPYDSAQSLLDTNAEKPAGSEQDFSGVPTVDGAGPILGLAPAEKSGQFTAALPTALPPRDLAVIESEAGNSVEGQPAGLPAIRLVQLALGAIALITGLAAFLLWRRGR